VVRGECGRITIRTRGNERRGKTGKKAAKFEELSKTKEDGKRRSGRFTLQVVGPVTTRRARTTGGAIL